MRKILFILSILFLQNILLKAQTPNDVLNLLIENKTITQQQADSIRAEAAVKQQEADANKKSFFVSAAKQIQLSGYTQIRYQANDEAGKVDGFDVRRARFDVKGTVTPYFSYRLQTEFANSPKVLDAYAEAKVADYFSVTVGQFKLPFSLENLASSNKLEAIDRSQAVEALVYRSKDVMGNHNGRDIGVQAGGAFLKLNDKALIDYRVAVFNGNGVNRADSAGESKSLVGRLVFHPIKGLDVGGSYLQGFEKFNSKKFSYDQRANHNLTRYGIEASYEIKDLSIRGEFLGAKDDTISRQGYYIQAGYYFIPKKLQALAKFDSYDKDLDTDGDKSEYYTLALSYNFSPTIRLQAAYTVKNEETAETSNNLAVVQFQVGF